MKRRRLVSFAAVGAACALVLALAGSNPTLAPRSHHPALAAPAGAESSGAGPGAAAAPAAGRPIVRAATRHDTSKPLRSITPAPPVQGESDPDADEPHPLPGREAGAPNGARDPVVQSQPGPNVASAPVVSFDGVNNINGVLPPDANGDIGPNDYVQWVNLSFAIYDRSGTKLYGPAAGSSLWNSFGGPCENTNNGDPIAQYDHLADRWVMSQFALPNYPNGPFYECVAVTSTADPLGAWHRYEFKISDTKLDDYPHLGVWPDGYYLSVNQFTGNTWAGAGAVVFERTEMLLGNAADMVYFDLFGIDPNLGGMLSSDLDGPAPPTGAPNVFVEADDNGNGYPQDRLDLWDFHVDWGTPANSTFTHDRSIATAAFDSNLCGYARNCIPQPGHPTQGLDALSDRIMYRLQYRNFGAYHTLVTTQTVDVDGLDHAGVRWFEVRDSGAGWAIRQQGTWAPDSANRWLASAAMNANGDIGIGYSVSSTSTFPSIRYTGRLAADPLGTLTQGEGSLMAGSGSQTHSAARWGDYANLAVDPVDNCTFWYTNEYLATTGSAPWRTRIGSFQLPGCGTDSAPPTVISFAPTTATPTNASTISYALTFSESVTGLTSSDFSRTGTATGCSIGSPSGSGASYTVAVTGCSAGTLSLSLAAASVVDGGSNAGPASPSTAATVTIDRTTPTLVLTATPSGSPTATTSFAVTATFGEAVSGFTSSDVSLGGTSNTATPWTVGTVSGGPSAYSFTVSAAAPADGSLTIAVPSTRAIDAAGNGNQASNTLSYTIDRTGPTATVAAPATPTNATTLSYTIAFSVPVTGLAATDFSRTGTATGCVIGAPVGSGASYTVALTGCSAGTVVLTLMAGTVTDGLSNAGPPSNVSAVSVLIDRTAPTTTAPVASLRPGAPLSGSTMPTRLSWSAADSGGAGVASYDIARSLDGAAFTIVLTGLTSPTAVYNLSSGHAYRYEIRTRDKAGNVGGWAAGPTLRPSLLQQTSSSILYHGTWTTATYASFSGGTARYATAAGASASYTFTGRSVGFVTTRAATRGAVKIYIDGVLASTIDLYAPSTTFKYVAFARTWASSGTHTIKIVVVGTAGRPRVDLDAIEVLR